MLLLYSRGNLPSRNVHVQTATAKPAKWNAPNQSRFSIDSYGCIVFTQVLQTIVYVDSEDPRARVSRKHNQKHYRVDSNGVAPVALLLDQTR